MVRASCLARGVQKGRSRKLGVRRTEMRSSIKRIVLSAVFTMGASSLLVAQSSNSWAEQWYRAKLGRPSPTEQARIDAAMLETSPRGTPTAITKSQIRRLMREAHTAEQYGVIADYYATQNRTYNAKAVEMMHLWRERNEMYYRVEKWPRPVDSARNLHDYYVYKASEAERLRKKYSQLADAAAIN